MSEMEESLEGLRKKLEAVEKEENRLRAQEVDIKHEVEKYETVLKENQQKVKHWQKEVYNAVCEQALHFGGVASSHARARKETSTPRGFAARFARQKRRPCSQTIQ